MELSGSASLVISNALTREGLSRILSDSGFRIAQSIATLDELVDCDDQERHIIVVDYAWEDHKMGSDIHDLLERFPASKLVILKDEFDIDVMARVFSAGAHGYILKDIAYQAFVAKMHLVLMDEKVAPSNLIDMMGGGSTFKGNHFDDHDSGLDYGLNVREQDILERLVMGQPNKLISRELEISEATVKVSVKSIFRKLSVKNRTQAAIMARECGMIAHKLNGLDKKVAYTLLVLAATISQSVEYAPILT
jgi:two-component system nitrate/nitrite response regulator NarL